MPRIPDVQVHGHQRTAARRAGSGQADGDPHLYLAAAILRRAKRDYRGKHTNISMAETGEVERFLSDEWFVTICDALGVDPEATRDAIRSGDSAA